MANDPVFAPAPRPNLVPPVGGAEVVYLRKALFVMHGVYCDPAGGKEPLPLPLHRFVLAHRDVAYSEGTTSDADGYSTIFEPSEALGKNDAWELWLVPIFDGRADSDSYVKHRGAFIDYEKRKWVPAEDVLSEEGQTKLAVVAKRKLLWIPMWSSTRKAQNGGFKQPYPHDGEFAKAGLIPHGKLKQHGSRDKAWQIAIDHAWKHAYVQLRFYDAVAKEEKCVPQGVLLQSRADDKLLGASSVLLPDGCIYHLHPTEKIPETMEYAFEAPSRTRLALDTGEFERVSVLGMIEELATHYPLPTAWCSFEQEAWEGPAEPSAENRKKFTEIRTKGADPKAPLCFHLDDMVLAHLGSALPLDTRYARMAILDAHLAVRDPVLRGGDPSPWSKYEHKRLPIRAEDAVFCRGQGLEKTTRIVEYWGRLFHLSIDRIQGKIGKDKYVGTRAATTNLFLIADDPNYETHLVDCRHVKTTYDGTEYKSAHVLVFVSCKVAKWETDDNDHPVDPLIEEIEHLLQPAAQQWDAIHPAHDYNLGKEYVLVPETGLHQDTALFRIRHFFAAREPFNRLPLLGEKSSSSHMIYIHPYGGRATSGDEMHLFTHSASATQPYRQTPAPPSKPHPKVTERRYGIIYDDSTLDDSPIDDDWNYWFTLAHELGHTIGFPDEYVETGDLGYPDFYDTDAQPYGLDQYAMMAGNRLQRLRYAWYRAQQLAQLREDKLLKNDPFGTGPAYVPRYKAPKVLMEHRVPFKDASGKKLELWKAVADGAVGRSPVSVFRLGDDESSLCHMFRDKNRGVIEPRVDGVIVVAPKVYFKFYYNRNYLRQDTNAANAADKKKLMYHHFGEHYLNAFKTPGFAFSRTGASELKRIGVVWRPRIVDWSDDEADEIFSDVVLTIWDVHEDGFALELPAGKPAMIDIGFEDIGPWVMRYCIDDSLVDPSASALDKDPLKKDDLKGIAAWLQSEPKLGGHAATVEDL